jgi:D-alanine--poly(phosphoribitol) ligase subunit 2
MDMETTVAGVRRAFLATLNVEVEDPDLDVIDSGLLDSLGLIELLFELEREFGVQLDLEQLDVDDLRTIRRIARVLGADDVAAASASAA